MFDLTQVSRRGPVAITTVLSICVAVQAVWFFTTMRTWLDEGNYLYKSSALIGHGMELYSLELPCWYTPFYLVALGVWQEALGYGLFSGRTFSVLCFVGSLLLTVFLLIVAVNLGGLMMWLREGRRPTAEAGFALLFFWSSLLHFVGTQTFCKSCAQAYMNYSILPGLIGAVGNLFPVARWIRQPRPMLRGAAPVVATLTILWVGLAWLPEGPYRKWYHPNPGKSIVDLARELDKRLPDEAHVLALGHDIRLVEGIHLSGRTVDPLTINYLFSLRDLVYPKAGIDLQKIEDIRQRGLWTHDLMRFWLARDYDYVVYLDKIVPHKDVLDRWYTSEPLFPGDSENVFLSSLRLAVRKEVAMNEEANQEE